MHYNVKKAVLGFEPMIYGPVSECSTHYTTPQRLTLAARYHFLGVKVDALRSGR